MRSHRGLIAIVEGRARQPGCGAGNGRSPMSTSGTSRQAARVRLAEFDVGVAREQAEHRLQRAALCAVLRAHAASGLTTFCGPGRHSAVPAGR